MIRKFSDDWKAGRDAELARIPEPPPIPAAGSDVPYRDVSGAWYGTAIVLPPVGLILGIIAASRNEVGPALALWATSLFVGPVAWIIFWNVVLAALIVS